MPHFRPLLALLTLTALSLTGCHRSPPETFLPGSAHPVYTITDSGEGMPSAINNHGQVIGMYAAGVFPGADKFPYFHGCLWQNGTRTEMPTLGGWYSNAGTIDDAGRVWGTATIAGRERPGFPVTHVCLWDGHRLTDLTTDPRFHGTQAIHETPSGTIYAVSPVQPADLMHHLWLFPNGLRHGPRKDLGKIGGPLTDAHAINDRGTVIGQWNTEVTHNGGVVRGAFIWHIGDKRWLDLGAFGDSGSAVVALNNKDQVIGDSRFPESAGPTRTPFHAFLWERGNLHDLGTLPGGSMSHPYSINNAGQVVGFSDTAKEYINAHPVLWENGQIKDLSLLIPAGTHWGGLSGGAGINDRGQIVGDGTFADDRRVHGYLLTPITPATR